VVAGVTAGRGLKQAQGRIQRGRHRVAAGVTTSRGLKQRRERGLPTAS
jgi:hypothetical protein